MGKFEVGHWMGTKKEEWGMREREQKYFGPVPAFLITSEPGLSYRGMNPKTEYFIKHVLFKVF